MKKRFGALMLSFVMVCAVTFTMTGCSSSTYTPSLKSATVTTPTIGQSGILRVGVNADNPPFAGQSSGKIVGLDVDIAAAIADELGLKLQVVDIGTDPDKAFKEGTIDIAMGVDKTDTTIKCWRSDSYIQSAVALFSSKQGTAIPTSASKPTISAQISSMSAWEVTKQYGDTSLSTTKDLKTAFSNLASGSVQYVAADAVIGTYAAFTSGYTAYLIGLLEKPSGLAIGVLDTNSKLKTVISDALNKLSDNGTLSLIETKWLGASMDLSDVPLTEGAKSTTTESVSVISDTAASTSSSTSASSSTSTSSRS